MSATHPSWPLTRVAEGVPESVLRAVLHRAMIKYLQNDLGILFPPEGPSQAQLARFKVESLVHGVTRPCLGSLVFASSDEDLEWFLSVAIEVVREEPTTQGLEARLVWLLHLITAMNIWYDGRDSLKECKGTLSRGYGEIFGPGAETELAPLFAWLDGLWPPFPSE